MSRSMHECSGNAFRAAELGFRLFYHRNSVNHCPGCGQAQWYIGRISAECAFCGAALPLQEIVSREARPVHHRGQGKTGHRDPHPT